MSSLPAPLGKRAASPRRGQDALVPSLEGKMPSLPPRETARFPPMIVIVFNIGYIERTISLEIESCHAQRQ